MKTTRFATPGLAALSKKVVRLALPFLLLPQLTLAAVIPNGLYLMQMADSAHTVFFSTGERPPRVALKKYSPSHIWSFEHLGNDYYKVTEQSYHLVLDSFRSEKYNGVPIITFPWHGGKNQRWQVIRKDEFYCLINQETGLALDLKNNQQKVGGVFQGYTANGSRGQLFRLTPLKKGEQQEERANEPADEIKSFSNGPGAE
ncbi:MAG: RICIN domain-containing protein [Desulfovibrio sp.]|uniref:RICIN domain-containing protein n=1 Tax=Desulfovibrio sp. TaxID=885 RepID=UPI00135ECD3A|nr:RICIN domain-containing protein [Desulfovibrio sp.]MTJ91244.1 RICIN domain-containing protein [Desulfovibrio sp.]